VKRWIVILKKKLLPETHLLFCSTLYEMWKNICTQLLFWSTNYTMWTGLSDIQYLHVDVNYGHWYTHVSVSNPDITLETFDIAIQKWSLRIFICLLYGCLNLKGYVPVWQKTVTLGFCPFDIILFCNNDPEHWKLPCIWNYVISFILFIWKCV